MNVQARVGPGEAIAVRTHGDVPAGAPTVNVELVATDWSKVTEMPLGAVLTKLPAAGDAETRAGDAADAGAARAPRLRTDETATASRRTVGRTANSRDSRSRI